MQENRTALVTGATAGIGAATARAFARLGMNIIVTGRRGDRLRELQGELQAANGVEVRILEFDIRDAEATRAAWESLEPEWRQVDILVNNAGLAAGLAPLHEGDPADWAQMIDTNVKGILNISRLVMPVMVARRTGHIVNLGSIAGKETYAKGAVYCASKHAVGALTQGMRIDLLPYGVKVTGICPGMVETEFSLVRFKGDQQRADGVYAGLTPLTADDIAETIAYAVTRPSHVCLNDIVIMPTAQANATTAHRE